MLACLLNYLLQHAILPSVCTSIGRLAFSYAAPQIWNDPLNIRISPSVSSFKHNFKNTLFCRRILTLPCAASVARASDSANWQTLCALRNSVLILIDFDPAFLPVSFCSLAIGLLDLVKESYIAIAYCI